MKDRERNLSTVPYVCVTVLSTTYYKKTRKPPGGLSGLCSSKPGIHVDVGSIQI